MIEIVRDSGSSELWTIGHGTLAFERFVGALQQNEITAVADVRTVPASSRAPDYNSAALKRALPAANIAYVQLGKELGGRPPEDEFYDKTGHVLYRPLSQSPRFLSGLERLEVGTREGRVAVLCSESDPDRCHRNLLVGRAMRMREYRVTHILSSGRTKPFDDHLVSGVGLPGLEEDPWRSLVRVRLEPPLEPFSNG